MQVAQIITEQTAIRNSRELAAAFGRGSDGNYEWTRIANYFVTTKNIFGGAGLGDDRGEIDGRMNRFHRSVGADMSERLTPITWNVRAAVYGMNTDKTNPTWQEIYEHLAPHKDYELPERFNVAGSGAGAGQQVNATNELRYEISDWVQTDRERFESRDQLREYVGEFWKLVVTNCANGNGECKRNLQFAQWVSARENPEDTSSRRITNSYHQFRRIANETLPAIIESEGFVSKQQVDGYLYAWLTAADTSFRDFRRN